jgi:hypothetical protein
VPACEAVMVQVAVATLDEPLRVVVDVVQALMSALPETVQVTAPVGVAPLGVPVTVAVKVTLPPSAGVVDLVTMLDTGAASPSVTVSLPEESPL